MKKRIKLKKLKSNKIKLRIFILIIFIILFLSIKLIYYISNSISDKLISYAKVEATKIAKYVVNYSVNEENIKKITNDNLLVINKNNDGDIESVDLNTNVINELLILINQNISNNLNNIAMGNLELDSNFLINNKLNKNKEGIILDIPIGYAFNSSLLQNIGPKIPIKLLLNGDILSNVETEIEHYGINNALLKVYVKIEVSEQVYVPTNSEVITVNQKVPLVIKMLQGVVPNCYLQTSSYNR